MNPSPLKPIDPENSFVLLGRIGRPHGVRGMLHVDLAGNHLRDFVGQKVALCKADKVEQLVTAPNILKTLILEKAEPVHGDVDRIAFVGFADRETAAELTNLLVVQPISLMRQKARSQHGRQHVPLANLWYFEMFGLSVVDSRDKRQIGQISKIEDLGKNTVVTITLNKQHSHGVEEITLPLEYPHWGEADLDRNEIQLAEWQHFTEL
ncbi:MAG: hypothetical protein OHK0011_00100 [Turneriella sp.]